MKRLNVIHRSFFWTGVATVLVGLASVSASGQEFGMWTKPAQVAFEQRASWTCGDADYAFTVNHAGAGAASVSLRVSRDGEITDLSAGLLAELQRFDSLSAMAFACYLSLDEVRDRIELMREDMVETYARLDDERFRNDRYLEDFDRAEAIEQSQASLLRLADGYEDAFDENGAAIMFTGDRPPSALEDGICPEEFDDERYQEHLLVSVRAGQNVSIDLVEPYCAEGAGFFGLMGATFTYRRTPHVDNDGSLESDPSEGTQQ